MNLKHHILISAITSVFIGISSIEVASSSPYVVTFEEIVDSNDIIPTTSRPLLGQRRCTRGPAYWCYNITQAKECGAVHHCISNVWEPMKLPADNDTVCDICKEMVKEARDQLLSNETQDELRQVLEGSCNLIPLKPIARECRDLADDFIPELIDALASRMDPQVVCAVSGLCNSIRIDEMLGQIQEIRPRPTVSSNNFDLTTNSCPKCTHFIGEKVESLKKLTKTELLHKIFELCGEVGSYSDSCRAVATEEIDNIYQYIQNELNPTELCGLFGLCEVVAFHPVKIQSSPLNVRPWSPPLKEDFQCQFCKQLVSYLKGWFTTDTTKEEFKEIVLGLCNQTRKYRQECINLAHEYADLVYNLLVEELDPEKTCIFLESCNATVHGRVGLSNSKTQSPLWTILVTPQKPLTKLTPAKHWTGDDERPSYQPGFAYPMTPLHPSERLTGDDERPSHQPGFGYPMIQLTPAEKLAGNDELTASVAKKGVGDILPTCGICTFTLTKLINMIGNNTAKEAIDEAMESVCYVIPRKYKDNCLVFMKQYGDEVARMIVLEGSAHAICTALHLCLMSPLPSAEIKLVGVSMLPFDRYMPQIVVADEISHMPKLEEKPSCPLCEYVISQLALKLRDNATEEEIEQTVQKVCHYLPRTVRSECRQFVDEYGKLIIEYLTQQLDPKEICTELRLCHGIQFVMENVKLDKCELCMLISDYLSSFLDDPSIDTSIEKLVERICPLLPDGHENECKELIEDYGPYLLSLLAQATDKGKACQTINFCPAS